MSARGRLEQLARDWPADFEAILRNAEEYLHTLGYDQMMRGIEAAEARGEQYPLIRELLNMARERLH